MTGSMRQGYEALTEKEKHTLRLLLAGHDAKSMARHLGLSVHTVNERLRDARRKLSAANSKEAARLLREAEGPPPEPVGDKGLGDARGAADSQEVGQSDAASLRKRPAAWAIGGLAMITLVFTMFALSAAPETAGESARPSPAATQPAAAEPAAAEPAATQSARQWLALVDAGKWQESLAATARSFQTNNTLEMWRSASEGGRVPLGRVLSRTFTGEESIPAPPRGYQLVRFRTDFSNKPGATETLSLAREDGSWRVAGYIIE